MASDSAIYFDGMSNRRRPAGWRFTDASKSTRMKAHPVRWGADVRRADSPSGILRGHRPDRPALARLEMRDAALVC